MKIEKVSTEYKITHDQQWHDGDTMSDVFIMLTIDEKGRVDVTPPKDAKFTFLTSDPSLVRMIAELITEACNIADAEIGKKEKENAPE